MQVDYGAFDKQRAASEVRDAFHVGAGPGSKRAALSGQAHMNGYAAAWVRVRAAFGDR